MSKTNHGADLVRRDDSSPTSPPSIDRILGGLALLVAIALLVSFYLVTSNAVAQADMHWQRASQASQGCTKASVERCAAQSATSIEALAVSHASR